MRLRGALRGGIAVSREARSNSLGSAVEIEWAPCSGADRFHDVQIDHRRGDTGVSHQLLDRADVDALLEEMGGKPNGVAVRQTERSEAQRVRESRSGDRINVWKHASFGMEAFRIASPKRRCRLFSPR